MSVKTECSVEHQVVPYNHLRAAPIVVYIHCEKNGDTTGTAIMVYIDCEQNALVETLGFLRS